MNEHDEEKIFLNRVHKTLDQGVDAIDDSTRAALRNIRKKTIARVADGSVNRSPRLQLYPMLATTAAIVLVVSVTLKINMSSSFESLPGLEDIPLLSASEDINFYQDLEFYQWLETEKVNG